MPRIVRCGLIQARNLLGPEHSLAEIKQAMIQKHVGLIEQAAKQGTQVLCLQELFYGPYFCDEQDPRWYARGGSSSAIAVPKPAASSPHRLPPAAGLRPQIKVCHDKRRDHPQI